MVCGVGTIRTIVCLFSDHGERKKCLVLPNAHLASPFHKKTSRLAMLCALAGVPDPLIAPRGPGLRRNKTSINHAFRCA